MCPVLRSVGRSKGIASVSFAELNVGDGWPNGVDRENEIQSLVVAMPLLRAHPQSSQVADDSLRLAESRLFTPLEQEHICVAFSASIYSAGDIQETLRQASNWQTSR